MDGFPVTGPPLFSPSLVRPVWADPGYFLALYNVKTSDVALSGAGTWLVAPARPDRWAVGFCLNPTIVLSTRVAPWGDPGNFPAATLVGSTMTFFKLFDFGPMVSYEWYANVGGAVTIRLVEVFNR